MDNKILITGASGLLGSCLMREFAGHAETVGTFHTHPKDGLVPLSLNEESSIRDVVRDGGFTHIIHSAALRSPDYCAEHPEEAYRTNSLAVEFLARAANAANATLLQISTDYVFPGETPPYMPDSLPRPVNVYGRTKLAGEFAARSAKKHLIVRIPALWRTDLSDTGNAATEIANWLRAGETRSVDATTIRYYTLAEDIAAAIRFLLDTNENGIFQLSAEQKTTKAGFARALCRALGLNEQQVVDGPPPATEETRPLNSHLDTTRYRKCGGPAFTGVDAALRILSTKA